MAEATQGHDERAFTFWCAIVGVTVVYNGTNLLLHAIFTMKYWILSKKVDMLLLNKVDF